MTRYELTPEAWAVYNEFDKQGLLLGLPRISEEKNISYKQRLLDVFVNRANSTARGLINGITRELGLNIINCIQILPVTDSNGDSLLTMPAVIFEETKCYLYSDFENETLLTTLDRWDISGGVWDLLSLEEKINDTGYFNATLLDDANSGDRSMTIFNQSSIQFSLNEDISGMGTQIHLGGRSLIPKTITIRSPNLTKEVDTQIELQNSGDYLLDLENGILYTVASPAPGSFILYQYRDDAFIAQASPVILHNLQSDDFKTKMFEQIENEDGTLVNGRSTALGANIINELLSVYPTNWGK